MEAEAARYYSTQSFVTDPGGMSERLRDLPHDLAGLQRVARALVIHYRADDPAAHGIADERLAEIDSRYADTMLGRIAELDGRPLTEARPMANRIVGCCRDFTVLFLAMARSGGIPARGRVGFATYFAAGFNVDHELAEVWDAAEGRWRLVDAELGDEHADPNDGARVDPLDVARDRFLVGGQAWQLCRRGEADAETFLVSPELDIPATRSWPYLRHNVVHDLAALNKAEMILWDDWGVSADPDLDREHELLDRVAAATAAPDPDLAELRRLYETEPRLRVPAAVTSYSPLSGEPRTVALRAPGS